MPVARYTLEYAVTTVSKDGSKVEYHPTADKDSAWALREHFNSMKTTMGIREAQVVRRQVSQWGWDF